MPTQSPKKSSTSPLTFFTNLKNKPKKTKKAPSKALSNDISPLTFFKNLKDKPLKRKQNNSQRSLSPALMKRETSIEHRMKIIEKQMREIDDKVKKINSAGYHHITFLDGKRNGAKVLLKKL
uniref:Uncharacterized protein n=1 Tax=viral metagenome TaxID=1070528 RepID=A0A6C0L9P6_9ZZZZ